MTVSPAVAIVTVLALFVLALVALIRAREAIPKIFRGSSRGSTSSTPSGSDLHPRFTPGTKGLRCWRLLRSRPGRTTQAGRMMLSARQEAEWDTRPITTTQP